MNYTGTAARNNRWVNTSGEQLPDDVINRMIQAEIAQKYAQRTASAALQLQKTKNESDAEYQNRMLGLTEKRDTANAAFSQRSLDLQALRDKQSAISDAWKQAQGLSSIDMQNRQADAARTAGLFQAGTGLLGTALGTFGKQEPVYEGGKVVRTESALDRWINGAGEKIKGAATSFSDYLTPSSSVNNDSFYSNPGGKYTNSNTQDDWDLAALMRNAEATASNDAYQPIPWEDQVYTAEQDYYGYSE
jgi:hypothetical protein